VAPALAVVLSLVPDSLALGGDLLATLASGGAALLLAATPEATLVAAAVLLAQRGGMPQAAVWDASSSGVAQA
jgi:hypothetical protein